MIFPNSLLLLMVSLLSCTSASVIVSESRNRLPMSLSTVVSDLEAEGSTTIKTACVIPSRTVTAAQKQSLLQSITGCFDEEEDLSASTKAVATAKGLALCQPSHLSLEEVVSSCVACEGSVVFNPSITDLKQGEGVMELLAPAMERLLHWRATTTAEEHSFKGCLVVVCDKQVGVSTTKSQLEAAAKPILENFSDDIKSLQDVFGQVLYVTADQVEATLLEQSPQVTTPEQAMARVASVVEKAYTNPLVSHWTPKITKSPLELAAARTLVAAQRQAVASALTTVNQATSSNTVLVPDFGALCDATCKIAVDKFETESSKALLHTAVGKQLLTSVTNELASEWMDVFEQQLVLLQQTSFDAFRASLGKLRLGPTLPSDMEAIIQDTVADFDKAVGKLVPKHISSSGVWKTRAKDCTAALARRLHDFGKDRLVVAQASGQFKPIPRKGVTIGMHWLLPKPFGNDFRQEPWMQHATDNMVYVPKRSTKVTEVPPESVASTGDWRDQIVPSPAGREMVFMQ